MGLTARHLESNGIPTVILGSALDIVSHCGVPRFYFVDFPLGNPCGKPYDVVMQKKIVSAALSMFETSTAPRALAIDENQWGSEEWRERYMQLHPEDLESLRQQGEERRRERQRLRDLGQVRNN